MEQLAEISAKKKKAREFQAERAGSGPKRAFRDDNQEKIIPEHGRRGRGRIIRKDINTGQEIKTSSRFSAELAQTAYPPALGFIRQIEGIIGTEVTAKPDAVNVVLDANVVVYPLMVSSGGNDRYPDRRRVLDMVLNGELLPYVLPSMIFEYANTVNILALCSQNPRGTRAQGFSNLAEILKKSSPLPIPKLKLETRVSDPDDRILFVAYAQLLADHQDSAFLVTEDYHLLRLQTGEGILAKNIVTSAELLEAMEKLSSAGPFLAGVQ